MISKAVSSKAMWFPPGSLGMLILGPQPPCCEDNTVAHGEGYMGRNQGSWPAAPAECPARSQHSLGSCVKEPSWNLIL